MSIIKKVSAVFVATLIFVCSLVVPVFAEANDSFVILPVLPYQNSSASEAYYAFTSNRARESFCSNSQGTIMFHVSNTTYFYFVSSSQNVTVGRFEESTFMASYDLSNYNNDSGLYYGSLTLSRYDDIQCPEFSTFETGISAAADFLSSSGSSDSSFPLSYDLPAGNVAFIELNSESASGLSKLYTTMPEGSGLFASGSGSSGSDIWRGNTQMYCYANSLPSGSVSFPMAGMSLIPWSKYGQQNLFGVTKSAGWTISNINTSGYLVIYNPLAYVAVEGGNGAETEFPTNGSIHINIPAVSSIKVLQLNASATISPGVAPSNWQTSTDTGNTWDASYDPDTGAITWTDQNGNTGTSPTVGGSNIVSGTQSIMELLSSFFSRLSEFFTLGYNAISTLVGSASEFVSHFMALYSWLPPGVLSVLTSALVLALTIGVIKIFI